MPELVIVHSSEASNCVKRICSEVHNVALRAALMRWSVISGADIINVHSAPVEMHYSC